MTRGRGCCHTRALSCIFTWRICQSGGSDAGSIQSTAVLDGDEWVLNGTKYWITNFSVSGFYAISERLGIAQLTYVDEVVEMSESKVVVKKSSENGEALIEAQLPAVISLTGEVNKPRYMNIKKIKKQYFISRNDGYCFLL